jgi:hypothetical protein
MGQWGRAVRPAGVRLGDADSRPEEDDDPARRLAPQTSIRTRATHGHQGEEGSLHLQAHELDPANKILREGNAGRHLCCYAFSKKNSCVRFLRFSVRIV